MRRLILALLLSLAALVATPPQSVFAREAGPRATERIEAELVSLPVWATRGSTVIVAVRQEIRPGWHTYWRNPGDSGGPTTLNWTLPAGVTAGDIIWPLPGRQRLASLMNYGYEGQVYLPVPIAVPATLQDGDTLVLTVDARFLVCSAEMCVPDDLTLSLSLPVRDGAAPRDARHAPGIERALAESPRPAGIEARAALADGVLTLSATGGPLSGASPRTVWFLPYAGGLIDHAAVQPGRRGPDGVTLALSAGRRLKAAGLTGPFAGVLVVDGVGYEVEALPGPPLPGTAGDGATQDQDDRAGGGALLFAQAALFALLGGLILNLMPCVFPILAMKAAALAAVAGDPRAARRDGLGFLAGVLTTFLSLAGVLLALRTGGEAVGWGFQLQSPPVVAGLALLMLAVALNLSGVFHVGAGLQGAGSGPLARLPGGLGAFFTGVLAVVVAAPCTAPFMAFALGAAVLMPWPMALAVFLMLGLGFALPFVAASLSPALIRRLPRPGPWMAALRSALAFPMYGAALWLSWVFGQQTGAAASGLLLGAGLALAVTLWLAGRRQAARAEGRSGALTLTLAAVALIATIGLAILAQGATRGPAAPPETAGGGPVSQPWSEAALQRAVAEGRPVFVNLTADWCVTCKINEQTSLRSPAVAAAFEGAGVVYLVGDWTRRDAAISRELERRGRSGVPLYLVYAPGEPEPRILPQILTEGAVIDAVKAAAASRG